MPDGTVPMEWGMTLSATNPHWSAYIMVYLIGDGEERGMFRPPAMVFN